MTFYFSQAGPDSLPADQPAKLGRPEENLRVLRHSEEER
jgi:hypothetical protein